MPKHISVVEPDALAADRRRPVSDHYRITIITLDNHLSGAAAKAAQILHERSDRLRLSLHAASDWAHDPSALERCRHDIEHADIIIATMLFMEDHIQAVLPWLQARREHCDAMIGCIAAGDIIKLTKLGRFAMHGEARGPLALLKRLRGKTGHGRKNSASGAQQMAMLRRLPKLLRFIPGTAQDVRAYFLCMQYWLASSAENMAEMAAFLTDRYADGRFRRLRGKIGSQPPVAYPDCGVYHPDLSDRISDRAAHLPRKANAGTVGVLIMRSYVLAKDSRHYDAVIRGLEARGLNVITAFACGLDARDAISRYFVEDGRPQIDAMLSLTGFSLVGGPAYNDAEGAAKVLAELDVPYLAAHAVEFQDLGQWRDNQRGLMPVEATMMVAIPELDGATGPMVFGGRGVTDRNVRDMLPVHERVAMLTSRVEKLVTLRRKAAAERKLAIVLFNFPPNAGATGTAAYLDVFQSLFNTLKALAEDGYDIPLPASAEALRRAVLEGNAERFGTDANIVATVGVDDHIRREPFLDEIEQQWGAAPGRVLSDGRSIFIQGLRLGQIFIGIQPGFGYEGDPMRLLFERSFAPTHAFSAFYRYLRQDFGADALLHFGMHGALEFMPGKQVGMSEHCWPDRLIGDVPNFYLYAANNPSEGSLAKRRSAATLITHRTPSLSKAGLYRGLLDLKASLDHWRGLEPDADEERARMVSLIQDQAAAVDLAPAEPVWEAADRAKIDNLRAAVMELEQSLIPHGLHVVGRTPDRAERVDLLQALAESRDIEVGRDQIEALLDGAGPDIADADWLLGVDRQLLGDHEIEGIRRALAGRFIAPVAGGDVLRSPDILPTGRNMHGFDPFRLPSAIALREGALQAQRLLERHMADQGTLPQSVGVVLWGTDNLKSEGGPIGQVLSLIGARPRFDSYGRLCGAALIPLAELGRPRIDVVVTLSGIFRDLLPLQIKLLAEACYLAASADEPLGSNFVRAHALAYQARHACDFETAALRIFSNADGVYGSNVNHLIDCGGWDDEDELAHSYTNRKCYAYGRDGKAARRADLLQTMLGDVQMAYQNLESVEVGVTTIDHYFDTLGGISRAVRMAKGGDVPVYIGDETRGEGKVRTLGEQVALETRTRMLNPKWYEGMLAHGYEGVRQIETHVTNTMGWSATTGQVDSWVYKQITQTFILDEKMRERMAAMNPKASARVANRLLEAQERAYWQPDDATLEALRDAGEELEDRVEGIGAGMAA